jgi:hypothetical protein
MASKNSSSASLVRSAGKCPLGANFLLLRRTLVRRNNRKFVCLAYEAFYLAIGDFDFLGDCGG